MMYCSALSNKWQLWDISFVGSDAECIKASFLSVFCFHGILEWIHKKKFWIKMLRLNWCSIAEFNEVKLFCDILRLLNQKCIIVIQPLSTHLNIIIRMDSFQFIHRSNILRSKWCELGRNRFMFAYQSLRLGTFQLFGKNYINSFEQILFHVS